MVRGVDAFEIGCGHSHRSECNGQLRERGRFEGAAGNVEQLERLRDVGNRLGANRVIGNEQRGQLGDLRQRGANRRGIVLGTTGCDARGTQGSGGVLRHTRQGLGKFQCV